MPSEAEQYVKAGAPKRRIGFFSGLILFIDKANKDEVVLIDASGLGEKIKDGKNQKTVLSRAEEQKI